MSANARAGERGAGLSVGDGRDVDVVVTTGPPDSVHLIGLALGRRRPAWIADFRDGWSFEPLREPFPTAAQRRLDVWLEGRAVRAADAAAKPSAYPAARASATGSRPTGSSSIVGSSGSQPSVGLVARSAGEKCLGPEVGRKWTGSAASPAALPTTLPTALGAKPGMGDSARASSSGGAA